MSKGSIIAAIIACFFLLTGCNTIHGMGKDIEKGGEAIQRAVK
ncbi:MAG: entericidin A/B family lipoprotein [Desulfobacteraceae bacterium]|nr:entericidin A/B family lipoprotein [Desulfobacteraceae bacterium]